MVQPSKGWEQVSPRVFVIMSDQPDCCGECGSRSEVIDERPIAGEQVFVGYCGRCVSLTLLVEE